MAGVVAGCGADAVILHDWCASESGLPLYAPALLCASAGLSADASVFFTHYLDTYLLVSGTRRAVRPFHVHANPWNQAGALLRPVGRLTCQRHADVRSRTGICGQPPSYINPLWWRLFKGFIDVRIHTYYA